MIRVEQTRFTALDANCHAACIASILEMPLEAIPQPNAEEMFCDESFVAYLERLVEFLKPLNLSMASFGAVIDETGESVHPSGYSILCATSLRTGGGHSVVAFDGEIVWDPHPQRDMGVGEWLDWTVFTVLDPSKPVGANA